MPDISAKYSVGDRAETIHSVPVTVTGVRVSYYVRSVSGIDTWMWEDQLRETDSNHCNHRDSEGSPFTEWNFAAGPVKYCPMCGEKYDD